ncbi:hypothetical protein [Taibaiella chishuiensis]|uniref:Uncharacterized protein n=1 Tax=Taibaiella chishuiensis TaxID=1434707 RepID=A0A2P8D104_9BACT|nr:hypothetical protein [Taibaiella chishuiensis]PSK90846.1 hypothetical protein B0I18_107258 [Taibaiella chishuiensis]
MYITDQNGKQVEVTDLKAAIKQAKMFKGLRHVDASPERASADDQIQAYWQDIYEKLLQLQSN